MADTEIRAEGVEATMDAGGADATALEGLSEKPKTFGQLAWERFFNHKLALVGAVGLVLIVVGFFVGPMFSQYEIGEPNIPDRLLGPSWDHPFGTDELGRDIFVRTAAGGRYSLLIGLTGAVAATLLGTILGALAGYFGKMTDNIVSQLINLVLIVPALIILSVFALRFGSVDGVVIPGTDIRFGGTWTSLGLILAALLWTRIARVVRGVILQIKEQEYIMAARAAGASHARIIFRHLLPNVLGAVAVEITLLVGGVIVLESTLSFLNLGVKPPDTSLGSLVRDAKGDIDDDPLRVLMPGIWIVLIVLCVNFLGDGLRDALDPRSKVEAGADTKKARKAAKKAAKKEAKKAARAGL